MVENALIMTEITEELPKALHCSQHGSLDLDGYTYLINDPMNVNVGVGVVVPGMCCPFH